MNAPKKHEPTPRQGPPPEDPARTPESTLPRSGQSPGKPDSTEADRVAESDEADDEHRHDPPSAGPSQPVNYPPKLI